MTAAEIEKAMIRASEGNADPAGLPTDNNGGQQAAQQVYNHAPEYQGTRTTNHVQYGPPGRYAQGYATQTQMRPELPQRDWRDYFVSTAALLAISADALERLWLSFLEESCME